MLALSCPSHALAVDYWRMWLALLTYWLSLPEVSKGFFLPDEVFSGFRMGVGIRARRRGCIVRRALDRRACRLGMLSAAP
jgi:hypothetical protein